MERNGKAENGTEGLLRGRGLGLRVQSVGGEAEATDWEGGCKRERVGPEKERRRRLEEAVPPLREEEAKGRLRTQWEAEPQKGPGKTRTRGGEGREARTRL